MIAWMLWGYGGLVAAFGAWMLYLAWRTIGGPGIGGPGVGGPGIGGLPVIREPSFAAPEPEVWPRLSILVPACNEALGIESAMKSLLEEEYPGLEIIAIDDRSTDETGAILDGLAAEHPRLVVEHVEELPEGWLGKVHALHRGAQRAQGDWILLADADVHLKPGVLKKILAYCEHHGIDHFTLIPEIWPSDFLADVAWGTGYLALLPNRLWQVPDPNSKAHVGAGAFNLLRRSAFEQTPGFEWFKLDVADDWAVGLLMKSEGKRSIIANGVGCVHLPWYHSFAEMIRGMEKNSYAILGQYSLLRCLALCVAMCAIFVAPLTLFAAPGWLWVPAAIWYVCLAAAGIWMHRWMDRPGAMGLLFPLGALLNGYILLRAGILGARRGGVMWRGTFYPKELMRKEMKVRF